VEKRRQAGRTPNAGAQNHPSSAAQATDNREMRGEIGQEKPLSKVTGNVINYDTDFE